METVKDKGLETLRELIIINNDRYEGYKTAAEETNEESLKSLFIEFSLQSKRFSHELRKLIPSTEKAPASDETKIFGDFYKSWMRMKSALTENDNNAILSSCELGEKIIKKNYDAVIEDPDTSVALLKLINFQRRELERCFDLVKAKQSGL